MPKSSSHETMARQWELLKLLPTRGSGITASELTNSLAELGFPVSKRTVERDLQELSISFGLYCNDKSKPYGWKWMDGCAVDLPSLALADALSLHLIEGVVRPLLPKAVLRVLEPRFQQAKTKLDTLAETNRAARWNEKVMLRAPTMPLLSPTIDEDILATVQEALLHELQLMVVYKGAGQEDSKVLSLHPLGLVQRGSVTYLVATAFHYSDVRLYAIHRLQSAELLSDNAVIPDGFTLSAYVEQGGIEFSRGERISFQAKVHRDVANYLRETPLSDDMRLDGEKEEWLVLQASVIDSWQFRWWLLSQGASLEVLSPPALRKNIALELAKANEMYR